MSGLRPRRTYRTIRRRRNHGRRPAGRPSRSVAAETTAAPCRAILTIRRRGNHGRRTTGQPMKAPATGPYGCRGLLARTPVDAFTQQVGVTAVPRVLLDHVDED